MRLFLICFCFLLGWTGARAQTRVEDFAYSDRWLRLLYYEGHNKSYRSIVREPFFYLSPQGADSPLAELEADLDGFRKVFPHNESHPQCRFPARYQLLREHFELQPPVNCPQFNEWTRGYQPKDLILVYASQFLSNPASVFGHSFVMVSSEKQIRSFWLTFNYAAAMPPDAGPIGYIVGGLMGWHLGDYSVMPYYNRMFQYGAVENRNLWLYTLKLTPQELQFFLAHMWELVHAARFTYYFMTENCAGVLLRTLAATLPDMVHYRPPTFYIHPMEVVKALDKAGRLAAVDLVPSQESKLRHLLKTLNHQQSKAFYQAINHPDKPLATVDAALAEALIEFTAYQNIKNAGELPPPMKVLERNALIARSKFMDKPVSYPKDEVSTQAPALAHDSTMVHLGAGAVAQTQALNLGYRFMIHDLYDGDAGFLKNSSIVGLDLTLSATRDAIWIKEFNVASVDNFQPLLLFDPKPSWRLKLAIKENLLTPALTDEILNAHGGWGVTLDWAGQYVYGLVTADFNAGTELPQARLEAGAELGAIVQRGPLKLQAQASAGQGVLDGANTVYNRASGGASWQFRRNFSVIQQSEWTRLPLKGIEGYRLDLGFRYYY